MLAIADLCREMDAMHERADRLLGLRAALAAEPVIEAVVVAAAEIAAEMPVTILSGRDTAVLRARQAAIVVAARLTSLPHRRLAAAFSLHHRTVQETLEKARLHRRRDKAFSALCTRVRRRCGVVPSRDCPAAEGQR